jgi:hypothetical protein
MRNGKFENWRLSIKVDKRWLATFVGEEFKDGTNITSDVWDSDGKGTQRTFNVLLMCLHAVCPPGPLKTRMDKVLADLLPGPLQRGHLQRSLPDLDDRGGVDIPF